MVKGKITTDRGMVEELFSPFHLFIEAGDRSEMSEKLVREKLAQMKVRAATICVKANIATNDRFQQGGKR